ncbi:ral GTPase-activating protein subunit alpha-2-like, partial [Orycteropus afer afer]|uniref:Ral GTPase-activating protein subunit alpha-2-like n=1 Tax=Orycteropus afer afer TaxID=1230840 RepID=A0A8B7B069_ORYAF
MFSRRSHGDVKKSIQKVLDPKKDVLTRLKHLRALLGGLMKSKTEESVERGDNNGEGYGLQWNQECDVEELASAKASLKEARMDLETFSLQCHYPRNLNKIFIEENIALNIVLDTGDMMNETVGSYNVDACDLKQFFETNYSQIYFIFYENFITLENSLKLKGNNKSQREELDSILFLFEKILQFLPERIFFRWHYQSIGSTLKKLLHTGNSIKIRCEGIRLFLLWLQALQTNCAEEQVLIFACLVPGFPTVMSSRGPCTLETLLNPNLNVADAKIYPEEITPLVPAISGEKITEDQTCYFLQILLKYMVIQAASLEWKNKENQDTGFKFLFTLFRKYYLPHLFPSFTKLTNIYKPVLDIPHLRPKPAYITTTRDNENIYSTKIPYMAARVVFIKWIVTFFLEKKYLTTTQNTKNGVDVLPKIIQAFLLPSCDIAITRKVVQVYRKWILQDKPVFMEEPDKKDIAQENAEKLGFSETESKEASSESSGHKRSSSWGRTYSFTSAVNRGCVIEEESRNVKAGAQVMLQ